MLVEHVEVLAQLGYGYTNSTLKVLGGDLAFHLKRGNVQKPLSNNWLDSFLRRWSDRLKSINPRSLENTHAKGSTPEVIDKYYQQLDEILIKYDLNSQTECIYN